MNGRIAIIHEGKKQYKCYICNNEFTSKHAMNITLKSFMKERDNSNAIYVMLTLEKNKYSLNIHIATVHEGKEQFKCRFCNHEFKSKSSMKCHIEKNH